MLSNLHRLALIDSQQILVLSFGFEPLYKTNWKRALTAVVCGRAEVIETHKTLWLGTGSGRMKLPTKVRFLTKFVAAKIRSIRRKYQKPTKRALWLRDDNSCQYCSKKLSLNKSTIDHVRPRSRGGNNVWSNLVIACVKCNQTKANALLVECKMKLIKSPSSPGEFVPVIN
jgi:5-methylcytosine-specific restriction endonuclease McrA